MSAASLRGLQGLAVASLLGLIALSLAWELWLAPLRPGGSTLVLKVLPLLAPLLGLLKGRRYTFQWTSLLVWLYFAEGIVRATSDPAALSARLAWIEAVLAMTLFVACTLYARQSAPSRQPSAAVSDR